MRLFNYYPPNRDTTDKELEKKIFRHSLVFPVLFLLAFWLIKISEDVFGLNLTNWGIYPMHWKGIKGILLSPFVHGSYKHLMGNSVPFLVLSFTLFFFYRKLAYRIFALIYILSGICVWFGAREAWHIGASGVIYGLASFLFFSGIFRNDTMLLTISLTVVFLYGSLFWGIFPIEPEISWEGHLWGAISGIVLSVFYRNRGPKRPVPQWEEEENEDKGSDLMPGSEIEITYEIKEITKSTNNSES